MIHDVYCGSRIPGSVFSIQDFEVKKHRIQDPDPQHLPTATDYSTVPVLYLTKYYYDVHKISVIIG
jgi:hypothetical protein